jgi:mono/diheme cytochrome c family protein
VTNLARVVVALMAVAAGGAPAAITAAQTNAARTVWNGVYTREQAVRGKREFERFCAECHGSDLGGLEGPPLAGRGFFDHWREDSLDSLFSKIQTRMPPRSPGSLSPQTTADLLAYVLGANELPAGAVELAPDAASLSSIRVEGRDGRRWALTNATAPVRTRDTVSTVYPPGARPGPGRDRLRLMDAAALKPERYRGQMVEAKGLLMREPAGSAINVTALQSIASACP